MSIWCQSCRSLVNAPCASHRLDADPQRAFCRRFRSTKGASKARRDHINHEIRNMRALLPVGRDDQERLSYLHAMAAICTYIRKTVLLQGVRSEAPPPHPPPPSYEAFLPALHGFILVTTSCGKLVYVSENVVEYLGLSMVDVLQGDTLYDMVERSDVDMVKSKLDAGDGSSSDRSFICQMQTSKAFRLQNGASCSMLVTGSFRSFPDPCPAATATQRLFVAMCTPTVNHRTAAAADPSHAFSSVHSPDMTFTQVSDSVLFFLGYSAAELSGRSWYSLVHPEDLSVSADAHRSLLQADQGSQVQTVLRLQCKDLSWCWIYTLANKDDHVHGFSCTNVVISETEARFLKEKISSAAFRPSSPVSSSHLRAQSASQTLSGNAKGLKRRRTSCSRGEESGKRRELEQDVLFAACSQSDSSPVSVGDDCAFTPPYTPPSSCSPPQKEELSPDLLMDVHGYADQLSRHSPPEPTFHHGGFGAPGPTSDSAPSSPTYDFPSCPSDVRLVPDCLSVSDTCENLVDCALHQDDLSLLEQQQQPQGGALVPVHAVHAVHTVHAVHAGLLTPTHSPPSQYSEIEQAEISILAQQISSLASSFDMFQTLNPSPAQWTWSHPPPPPPPLTSIPALKQELDLDESVFDSILDDLDLVSRKTSGICPFGCEQDLDCVRGGSTESLREDSSDHFTTAVGQNTGLHQLQFLQTSLHTDGLAEENLY